MTKQLLREHLLLSEQSRILIKDTKYVTEILGITDMNDRVSILNEQMIVENMLTSIKNYVGNEYNKVINSIRGFKDIALLIKDLITDSNLLNVGVNSMKKTFKTIYNQLTSKIQNLMSTVLGKNVDIQTKLKGVLAQIDKVINGLTNKTGWQGFLMMLGFATLLKWIETTFLAKIIDKTINFVQNDGIGILTNVLNSFKGFFTEITTNIDITEVINWFTAIGKNTVLQGLTTAMSIVGIISEIVSPIMKSVEWSKKLSKT